MSKVISLVEILGKQSQNGFLKEKDIQIYEKIQKRMCDQLKVSMQVAIDQFNEDLEQKSDGVENDTMDT
jgi:hypothetical protein